MQQFTCPRAPSDLSVLSISGPHVFPGPPRGARAGLAPRHPAFVQGRKKWFLFSLGKCLSSITPHLRSRGENVPRYTAPGGSRRGAGTAQTDQLSAESYAAARHSVCSLVGARRWTAAAGRYASHPRSSNGMGPAAPPALATRSPPPSRAAAGGVPALTILSPWGGVAACRVPGLWTGFARRASRTGRANRNTAPAGGLPA